MGLLERLGLKSNGHCPIVVVEAAVPAVEDSEPTPLKIISGQSGDELYEKALEGDVVSWQVCRVMFGKGPKTQGGERKVIFAGISGDRYLHFREVSGAGRDDVTRVSAVMVKAWESTEVKVSEEEWQEARQKERSVKGLCQPTGKYTLLGPNGRK